MRIGRQGRRIAVVAAVLAVLAAGLTAAAAAAPLKGALDTSFGTGGRVVLGFGPTFANSAYRAMVRQPDGAVLLAGKTESVQEGKYVEPGGMVQRRLPGGALDPSFREVRKDEPIAALALQADGDVLYATGGEYFSSVHRLNPDGTVDDAFGKHGARTVPLGVRFLAVDGQGRTVIAGSAPIGGDCHDCLPTPQVAVARLLANGAPDKSFGDDGVAVVGELKDAHGPVTGLVLGADGPVIVAGERALYGLTAVGRPNPAFGSGGTVAVDGSLGALAQTTSGDLVTAGSSASSCCSSPERGSFVLRAFSLGGQPDEAWGTGGKTEIAVADVDVTTALAPTPGGGVILGGETAASDDEDGCLSCEWVPYVARLGPDGVVDAGFSAPLTETPEAVRPVGPLLGYPSRIAAITAAPGGQVLLAGMGEEVEQATLTALGPSGALDPGFGTAGVAAEPQTLPSQTGPDGIALGPGGSLAVAYATNAGSFSTQRPALAGWSADGEPLPEYGSGELDYGRINPGNQLAADSGGRVYRWTTIPGRAQVFRFGSDGKPDPSYGTAGVAPLPSRLRLTQVIVRPSGVALAIGTIGSKRATKPMALFELDPEGHPVRSFGRRGLAKVGWGKGFEAEALAADFDRRGRIVVFGLYGRQTPLARLLSDGGLDRSFGHNGRVTFRPEINVEFSSITVAPDGRIYLVAPGDSGETTIARFHTDGSRDRSFGERGIARANNDLPPLRLFAEGRQLVLVAGSGSFGNSGFELRAFHLDGSLDRSFGEGGRLTRRNSPFGPIGAVRQADGRIVLAGPRNPHRPHEALELLRFR
jgi:uncharacterized delta-60 repeat protein